MLRKLPKPARYTLFGIAGLAGAALIGVIVYGLNVYFAPKTYAYDAFAISQYGDMTVFDGPRPGEMAVDFVAYDLDGKEVRLSDFIGKTVVLETGSITCPMFVGRMADMRGLVSEFPDVVFLIHYVREAHPGMNYPQPHTMEEKIAHARDLTTKEDETRTILVEELNGKGHQVYGGWPNSVYVIDPAGVIAYRQQWADPPLMREALQRLAQGEKVEELIARAKPPGADTMSRVMWRAGPDAMLDFSLNVPIVAIKHIIAGDVKLSDKKS
jgi:hypothetical protein